MRNKNNSIMSKRGTIRYIDGQFYDSRFRVVFAPLTNQEYHHFCNLVEAAEDRKGTRLSDSELNRIVRHLSNGGQVLV